MVLALALASLAVAHLDGTDRSWILYYDSDSVLPALVRGSLLAGQPQNWALSAVLFIPEMALYLVVAALGLGIKGTFALNGVVNLLILFAVLRFLSGFAHGGLSRTRRVSGAVVAFATLVFLILLEDSPRQDTFELASLLATTTYYSMTVLASVLTVGIVARLSPSGEWTRWRSLKVALVATSALSTVTNPLYIAWAVLPLMLLLILLARQNVVGWHLIVRVGGLLLLSSGAGLVARIPLAHLVSKDGPAYAQPGMAGWAAAYYPQLVAHRTSTAGGAAALTLIVCLVLVSVVVFGKCLGVGDSRAAIVSGMGWMAPVAVIIGMICVGAFGARYLQPLFFAPVCTVVFAPRLVPTGLAFTRSLKSPAVEKLLAGAIGAGLAVSAGSMGSLSNSAGVVDSGIQCVVEWINATHGTGAGNFWTIRGPKAYLSEPSRLVQVDKNFQAYPWLTDRADYSSAMVSFVISDAAHPPPTMPSAAAALPSGTIHCGRYTITDFGADVIPIGPPAALQK
ncbi:hypothetical protein [Pseudarthrobacter sp. BRE9]|uniref:hypothetical protein n=1 Tax=Pseudarthrobacter sp. BRE9 TaxID=2962582 RepID=UPI002880F247|nr:hypothetical protein [Pseudarthrobacter sp. BRE9]MDT0170050.1 hypothetical protein [Pseudarthrobacter sp. BRE9]